MRPALLVFGYALVVAWLAPPLLTRLTTRGISARLGLAACLTAMASVVACAIAALQFLVRAAITGWPSLAEAVCRSVTGSACAPTVYKSAAFEAGLGATALLATLTAAVLSWRYGRSVQRARRRTHEHAELARMTGRSLPGGGPAMVLDAEQPVAYCVPGRPAAIVLSSGALAVLDPAQLTAVLAHERAHLAGRHHVLTGLTRALSACFPAVPVFARGAGEVARLAEMCADDAAARRSGRPTLIAALLAMGTGTAVPAAVVPATALAATGCAVMSRVQRLLDPPGRAVLVRYGAALAAVTLLLAAASVMLTGYAGPLATHALALI
ncbi:MAG TPA: M56 family metallopeptidase [Streptosporangiaceae bacterium]|nr:M56 family metallopeptidase [Streptosporangiaceae bacterium]